MTGNKTRRCNYYRQPMYKWTIIAWHIINCVWYGKVAGFLVDAEIGNVTVYAGQSVTLTCDLNQIGGNKIFWFHERYYLSYQETIHSSLPRELDNRLSVVCDTNRESCSMTISNVALDDGGTYECGHLAGPPIYFVYLAKGYLNVLIQPPSENSPFCLLFQTGKGRRPTRALSQPFTPGEKILLKCLVNGTLTPPSLIWNRGDTSLTAEMTIYVLEEQLILEENDRGVQFTCLMTHPAISEQRNCSVTPLPMPTTTTDKPTTPLTTENKPGTNTDGQKKKATSLPIKQQQSLIIVIAASVSGAFVLIIIIIIVFIFCRRRKAANIPVQMQNNADSGHTVEDGEHLDMYSEIKLSESNGQAQELKQIATDTQSPAPSSDTPANTTIDKATSVTNDNSEEDVAALYAKPQKERKGAETTSETTEAGTEQYANLPHFTKDLQTTDNDTEGLMYADLDLSGNVDAQTTPTNSDATLYADIRGAPR